MSDCRLASKQGKQCCQMLSKLWQNRLKVEVWDSYDFCKMFIHRQLRLSIYVPYGFHITWVNIEKFGEVLVWKYARKWNNNRWKPCCPGKLHRFLLPFSIKFPHLNFAPYVLYIYSCYMKPVHDTNSEPELPVVYLHLPDCRSIVCICLYLKKRCMCRKPSRTHFILCLQCLFFYWRKDLFMQILCA